MFHSRSPKYDIINITRPSFLYSRVYLRWKNYNIKLKKEFFLVIWKWHLHPITSRKKCNQIHAPTGYSMHHCLDNKEQYFRMNNTIRIVPVGKLIGTKLSSKTNNNKNTIRRCPRVRASQAEPNAYICPMSNCSYQRYNYRQASLCIRSCEHYICIKLLHRCVFLI